MHLDGEIPESEAARRLAGMTADGSLGPAERKALKARAHALEPVVWIGDAGVTGAVIAEIERSLAAQELIKVRAPGLGREAREAVMAEVCARCAAQPVQHIGKVLVLYRRKPETQTVPRERAPGTSRARAPTSKVRAGRSRRARPAAKS